MIQNIYINKDDYFTITGDIWDVALHNKVRGEKNKVILDFNNNRVKYIAYNEVASNNFIDYLLELAELNKLDKIWGMCIENCEEYFRDKGFTVEGYIPEFFNGKKAFCMSYFLTQERAKAKKQREVTEILDEVKNISSDKKSPELPADFNIEIAESKDANELAQLYDYVFETYPTPLSKRDYISYLINNNEAVFAKILYNDKIVSAASAEMDWDFKNCEITDCATLPEFRGKSLMNYAVGYLENTLYKKGVKTFFSLSRSLSAGINVIFKKNNYKYYGTLINNCDISGNYEDLNLWVKLK